MRRKNVHDATATLFPQIRLTLEWTINFKFTVEQLWLQFTFAHAKLAFVPHNKANNKLNM